MKFSSRLDLTLPFLATLFHTVAVLSVDQALGQAEGDSGEIVRESLDSAARALSESRPREALLALDPAADIEPDNPWLLYYRGIANLHLGNPHEAMASLSRARCFLEGFGRGQGGLTEDEQLLCERINQYRREARRQIFKLTYQTGLAFDTNVTFLGDAATGLGLIAGREDTRFSSGLQIDYAPVAAEGQTLAVGARLGHSWHFSVEQFDYQDYGGYVRYVRCLDDYWQADVQYSYDVTYLGNEPFLSNHAITSGLGYRWRHAPDRFRLDRTRVYYQFEGRDFLFETTPEFDRDGCANSVGIEQSLLFQPLATARSTWRLAAGYRFSSVGTEGTEFERWTHDLYCGAVVPLVNPVKPGSYLILPDKELLFSFKASWQLDDYREGSLLDENRDERSDLITAFGFGLSQKLIEHPDFGDVVLHGLIYWTDADSSVTTADRISPYTYDNVVYGLQLEWSW